MIGHDSGDGSGRIRALDGVVEWWIGRDAKR